MSYLKYFMRFKYLIQIIYICMSSENLLKIVCCFNYIVLNFEYFNHTTKVLVVSKKVKFLGVVSLFRLISFATFIVEKNMQTVLTSCHV